MLRGISISACLAIAHFTPGMDASQATVELQKGICLGFMIIPACALLLSAVILLFGFKITREKVEQYRAEIDARRA